MFRNETDSTKNETKFSNIFNFLLFFIKNNDLNVIRLIWHDICIIKIASESFPSTEK